MPSNNYDVNKQPVNPAQNMDSSGPYTLGWELMGYGQEQREYQFSEYMNWVEFQQQQYMQQQQNEWNSEGARMERLIEAGVNPYAAAQGLAGSAQSPGMASGASTPTAPSSPSVAEGVSAATSAVDTFATIGSRNRVNDSQAKLNDKNAGQVDPLAEAEIMAKAAHSAKLLTESGWDEIEALDMALGLESGGLHGISKALSAVKDVRKIALEVDKIRAERDKIQQDYDQQKWFIENGMNDLMLDEQTKKNLLLDEEKRYKAAMADISEREKAVLYGYASSPYFDDIQRQWYIIDKYGINSKEYKAFLEGLKNRAYSSYTGQYFAQSVWKLPSNAYEVAAQIPRLVLAGIKFMGENDTTDGEEQDAKIRENLPSDNPLYRERTYDFDAMLDLFIPIVESSANHDWEYGLSQLMYRYGYSREDAFKFFEEFNQKYERSIIGIHPRNKK